MIQVTPPSTEEVSLLARAHSVMHELLAATKQLKDGVVSDPMLIAGLQAELVEIRWLVGEEFSAKFSAKEKAIISRKTGFANSYMKHRKRGGITVKDAEVYSLEDVVSKYEEEVDTETEFIHYRTLLASIDSAIMHAYTAINLSKPA